MEDCVRREWSNSARLAINEDQFEESAGRRRFYLIFDESSFYEYERRMLKESGCPYTLPMNFLYDEDKVKAYYDFTEFIILDEYINRKISSIVSERKNQLLLSDSLKVVTNIICSLKGMENYLLFPDRMEIEIGSIFIHYESSKVAFSFIPGIEHEPSLQSRIIQITEEIKHLYNHLETDQYFEKFINMINSKNLGLDGMINTLGEFQREISYIYWESKDFRAVEERELHITHTTIEVEEGRKDKENSSYKTRINLKMQMPLKPLILQIAFIVCLAAVYFSGALEIESFAGLTLLVVGIDLWLMRKLHYLSGNL